MTIFWRSCPWENNIWQNCLPISKEALFQEEEDMECCTGSILNCQAGAPTCKWYRIQQWRSEWSEVSTFKPNHQSIMMTQEMQIWGKCKLCSGVEMMAMLRMKGCRFNIVVSPQVQATAKESKVKRFPSSWGWESTTFYTQMRILIKFWDSSTWTWLLKNSTPCQLSFRQT